MLRTLFALIAIIYIFCINNIFAGDNQNYNAIIERQSNQINELNSRITTLEKIVNDLISKNKVDNDKPSEALTIKTNNIESKATIPLQSVPNQKPILANGKSEYELALASLKDSQFAEAEKKFADFIQQYPKHTLRENALFWYAESFYHRNDFNQAAINYLKGYKEFPKGAKAHDILLKLAFSLDKLNKPKEACSILDKLDAEFPTRAEGAVKRAQDARNKFGCKK